MIYTLRNTTEHAAPQLNGKSAILRKNGGITTAPVSDIVSGKLYLEVLSDMTIDGAEFTFTGGAIAGKKGWYPNVNHYPHMYIRDFAMTVRGRPSKFTAQNIWDALTLWSARQRGDGALPDGIGPDGVALAGGGDRYYAKDNSFEFVDLVYQHYLKTGTTSAFTNFSSNIAAAIAFPVTSNHLVVLASGEVGFGFQDGILSVGQELPSSVLRYRAFKQLSILAQAAGVSDIYAAELPLITAGLNDLWDESLGLFKNASVTNQEHSIPGNAMAVAFGAVTGTKANRIASFFYNARPGQSGDAAYNFYEDGMIRHLTKDVYWTSTAGHLPGKYQNGPFWATFTGWVATTLTLVNQAEADKLLSELVAYFKTTDQATVPVEYHLNATGETGAPRYCSSATLPLEYLNSRV